MNIQNVPLAAARRRSQLLSAQLLTERARLDFIPRRVRRADAQKFSVRKNFLADGGARPSEAELERLMGTNDLVDEFFLERALLAANPVCRISIRAPGGHERGCATGFMVSPRLLLTNQHVFTSAEEAAPSVAEFNYRFDVAGNPERSYRFQLRPDLFFYNHEALDFALVSVEPMSMDDKVALAAFGYHRLIAQSGKALLKEWMNIIQHPGGARRQFAIRENQCIEDADPDVIWYKSDTAQGSSGSPVFNDSFQVVALHHSGVSRRDKSGRYVLKSGQTVKTLGDVDDSQVDWMANAGIRVSRICAQIAQAPERNGHLAELRVAMQGGDVLSKAFQKTDGITSNPITQMNPNSNQNAGGTGNRIVLGTLVLELNGALNLGPGVAPAAALAAGRAADNSNAGADEAAKEPIIAPGLEWREGFVTNFLGVSTPLPTVTDKTVVAPLKRGGPVLKYEHFSLVMHKERRLAIYTASNVDGRAASKRPEAGFDYTRKGLTGLGDNDIEKWVNDPRLEDRYQLPDKFYTKDNGKFDKGHIVRREDVCFGSSFAQVQRGNGDTFHVTNCSPQRGNFNQSGKHGIWGRLENFIGAQADVEKFCLFAGPVLDPHDVEFAGVDDAGPVRVRIPRRFWKVVCAVQGGKLQVFAFLLEQEVGDLAEEFQLNAEWKHKLVPLRALERLVKLVKFQSLYHAADQGK